MYVEDDEITGNALDMLVRYFKDSVEVVHERIIAEEVENSELFLTFSTSLISMLPHLIAVSERRLFTQ